jgi:hypothetical protein
LSEHLDKIRAEIRAIAAETLEYMRVLHAEKMAKFDELEAWLRADRRLDRGRSRHRKPPQRTEGQKRQ